MAVEPGKQISLEYTLTLDNGQTVDTNVGKDPLVFTHGEGQILPALEAELANMEQGEAKDVTLPPEKGYGTVDPEAFISVSSERVPEDAQAVGRPLQVQAPDGQTLTCRVHEVKPEEVVLNFNHPLAGETLHFNVKVLNVA